MKWGHQIVNLAQAIAAEGELVRHRSHAVFTPKSHPISPGTVDREFTHESNANFLVCGNSGEPYGTTISAIETR